jgi:hypothetical protein
VTPSIAIVSGGQTGVDRAALDVALELGMACGGWCPKGRRAEDGVIHARYRLRESPSADSAERTEWNVRDSDGTLILTAGSGMALRGGTALARDIATRLARPLLIIDLDHPPAAEDVRAWLGDRRITRLNVAGPRESEQPGIGPAAHRFLKKCFAP